MAAPPSRRPSPAVLPDEIVEEILLRLPPEHPACLLRASLVCKTWSHALSSPGFRRRLHELHRTPPMLGFLHNRQHEHIPRFFPTTASSFSVAAPDRRSWRAIDYRHGRALFLSKGKGTKELLVWEPITGAQWRVPMPAAFERGYPNAAVSCAADGCDHRDCQGGPFHLIFLFYVEERTLEYEDFVTSACVYSSKTSTWGDLTSTYSRFFRFTFYSSVLVGRSLLYFVPDNTMILEYDLARHSLTVLDTPDYYTKSNLMLMSDGGLGVIQYFDLHLKLWSREVSDGTDARWLLSRVIGLENLLPDGALVGGSIRVLRFSEEANVIFVTAPSGLFTIELQSQRVRKLSDDHDFHNLFPVVNFYTPHSRLAALGGEHHYPPLPLTPTEEVGCKEGGGEEEKTTLEQTQEVFNKCKAMEEGNFTNSSDRFSHSLETRVPHHGELPPDNPSENVSRHAPNKESVKDIVTTSKDYPGSSEASGGVHGDSEEGY